MNNYEKIKNMTVEEMARFLTRLHCQECYYQDDWQECNQVGCWCHKDNGYQSYGQWLLEECEE